MYAIRSYYGWRLPHFGGGLGRRAEEGRVDELEHRGEGEQAADHRGDAEEVVPGVERGDEDQPLRGEAVERRQPGERQAREQEDVV